MIINKSNTIVLPIVPFADTFYLIKKSLDEAYSLQDNIIYYFIGKLFHLVRKTYDFFQLKPATAVPSVISLSIVRISK